MVDREAWVDADQVAAHLGVQKPSIYRWVDKDGLPAHRVGRLLRFKLSEIDAWVRSRDSASIPNGKSRMRNDSQ